MSEPEEKNQMAEDIEFLSKYEQFARLVEWIHGEREIHIGELHGASTDDIRQVSGMILENDKMLQVFQWEKLKEMHSKFLK